MDHSASDPGPVLRQEDYAVPDCKHPLRQLHGPFSKDDGKNSSRINMIIRQAGKYPGPGKYVAHTDWANRGGNKFATGGRGYKSFNNSPDPTHYENKDINLWPSNFSKEVLSHNPRVIGGRIPKGKRRSFLDGAIKHGNEVPDAGQYEKKSQRCDRLEMSNAKKVLPWDKEEKKTVGRVCLHTKVPEIACNHYHPSHVQQEARLPVYTIPKEVGKNFIDKSVKDSLVDHFNKIYTPGAKYEIQNFDLGKISRATKLVQLRGLTRSPASGYF